LFKYCEVISAWKDGLGIISEKPPPEVMIPPLSL